MVAGLIVVANPIAVTAVVIPACSRALPRSASACTEGGVRRRRGIWGDFRHRRRIVAVSLALRHRERLPTHAGLRAQIRGSRRFQVAAARLAVALHVAVRSARSARRGDWAAVAPRRSIQPPRGRRTHPLCGRSTPTNGWISSYGTETVWRSRTTGRSRTPRSRLALAVVMGRLTISASTLRLTIATVLWLVLLAFGLPSFAQLPPGSRSFSSRPLVVGVAIALSREATIRSGHGGARRNRLVSDRSSPLRPLGVLRNERLAAVDVDDAAYATFQLAGGVIAQINAHGARACAATIW